MPSQNTNSLHLEFHTEAQPRTPPPRRQSQPSTSSRPPTPVSSHAALLPALFIIHSSSKYCQSTRACARTCIPWPSHTAEPLALHRTPHPQPAESPSLACPSEPSAGEQTLCEERTPQGLVGKAGEKAACLGGVSRAWACSSALQAQKLRNSGAQQGASALGNCLLGDCSSDPIFAFSVGKSVSSDGDSLASTSSLAAQSVACWPASGESVCSISGASQTY